MNVKKKYFWAVVPILFSLVACQPNETELADNPSQPVFWITPQVDDGMLFYDGCTYMLAYPAELQPDGAGMLFEHSENPDIQVYVSTRRRFDTERDLELSAIAEDIAAEYIADAQITFSSTVVKDFMGKQVPALLGDSEMEIIHVQVLVTMIPDYLLMDMVKDDVIYYMIARAPQDDWSKWAPKFLAMFNNFIPKECGGV